MNTLPALPPVVYLAGRYMTSLDMFMAKVRDLLSSTRRNALMEQEHLLALYRDGVLLAWLRTLSPTDHRAGSMAESLEKMMQQTMTDTEAKKALGNLFGAKEARVTALRFDEYVELLSECQIKNDGEIFVKKIIDKIDVQDVGEEALLITLSFRVIKAANDVISVMLGNTSEGIPLQSKGKIHNIVFSIPLSGKGEFSAELVSEGDKIHNFMFNCICVDLGFGVKWATCNIGSKHPWEIGDYFKWGAIENVEKCETYCLLTCDIGGDPTKDCATAIKGSNWRLPARNHFKQLYDNCIVEEFNIHDIQCYKFTSLINKKCILIPVPHPIMSWYWSSTGHTNQSRAYNLDIRKSNPSDNSMKSWAMPVRPIYVG